MSNVFISYSQKDLDRAEVLVKQLRSRGVSIWWDRKMFVGDNYRELIKRKLHESDCVIVLWSKHSVDSGFVMDEATIGQKRNVLVPVLIDDVDIPLGFGAIHTESLVGRMKDKDALDGVAAAVHRLVGHTEPDEPAQEAAPRAPQPSRGRQVAAPSGGQRGLLIGAAVVLLAAVVGVALWWDGDDGGQQVAPGPGPEVTDGSSTTGTGTNTDPGPPPGPAKDPRLVEAQDRLASLIEAPRLDLGQALPAARTLLDTLDSEDPRTAELLDQLDRQVADDPEQRQQVADVRRWFGRPVGDGRRFDAAMASFEQELASFRLGDARASLARCRKTLPGARELSAADSRLETAEELQAHATELLAALADEPVHLPTLAAAQEQARALVEREPHAAQTLGLTAALAESNDAYQGRLAELLANADEALDDLARATSPRRLGTALASLDVLLAELPGDRVGSLGSRLETAGRAGAKGVLGSDPDRRAALGLLTALAGGRAELSSPTTQELADDLESQAVEGLELALADPASDQERARFVKDLAPCEIGLGQPSASADRLVRLAEVLLADLAPDDSVDDGSSAEPIRAAQARMANAEAETERLRRLFPDELAGRIGDRVSMLFDAVDTQRTQDLEELQGYFTRAEEHRDAGRAEKANDIYTDLLKQSEPGSPVRAAARLGKAEVQRHSLPDTLTLQDANDINDVIKLFKDARDEGTVRDLWDVSVPALSTARIYDLHDELRIIYHPLMDGGRNNKYRIKHNDQVKARQAEKDRFLERFAGEKDHEGQLLDQVFE